MAIFTTSERKRKEETIEVLRKEIKRQKACNDLVSHQLEKLQNDYKYCKSVVISYRNTLAVAEDFMEKNRGKTGKLAAACLSQTQGVYPSAPNKSST